MKKFMTFLIIILVISGAVFYAITKKNNTKVSNEDKDDSLKISGYEKYEIKCDVIENVKENCSTSKISNYFITNSGELYQISYNKLFSNNQNCIKVDLDLKLVHTIGGKFLDETGKDYFIDNNGNLSMEVYPSPIVTDELKTIRVRFNKYLPSNADNGNNLLFTADNKFKIYICDEWSGNCKVTDVISEIPEDEVIINMYTDFIVTDKAYYNLNRIGTNSEECSKYLDIDCEYKYAIQKNTELTDNYDKIIYASDDFIVDKSKNFYIASIVRGSL